MKHLKFLKKVYYYLKKKILFFNVSNKNVQNQAYNQLCYNKLEKKFSKVVNSYEGETSTILNSNKVWFCWFQGIEEAPSLVKACYESIKKNMPDKEIVLITEKNYNDYVQFPDYIVEKRKKGYIENAHFSDLIRLDLLRRYGGLWIDSTVFVSNKISNSFFENDLFVFKDISLYQREEMPIRASNWLIYSKRNNNNIIGLTEKLVLEYWKKYNYPINYFFFHIFFSIASKKFNEEWLKIPNYSNISPHILQFELKDEYSSSRFDEIKRMSDFHKLNYRIKSNNSNSFYNYIINIDKRW